MRLLGTHIPRERGCGTPKGRERERKRGRRTSLLVCGVSDLDALGMLGEIPLNRHKEGLSPIQSHNTSPTCIGFPIILSYSTYIRNSIRCQLLEPLHPIKHTLFCTQEMPHMKLKSPLNIGYAQLKQIKVAPMNNYQEN